MHDLETIKDRNKRASRRATEFDKRRKREEKQYGKAGADRREMQRFGDRTDSDFRGAYEY